MNSHQRQPRGTDQRGQALVEYALILVLVALAFGLALAATVPSIRGVFERSRTDVVRSTQVSDIPSRNEFWATVTANANYNPQRQQGIPTNTRAAPTAVPTDGPSPTPSKTPQPTPTIPTPTPTLTPTQVDRVVDAPIYDSIDNEKWWRADYNIALGGTPWTVNYYANTSLSGDPVYTALGQMNLDYTFKPGEPPAVGLLSGENFSLRATRKIRLDEAQTIAFQIETDDGARLFVNGNPVTLRRADGGTDSWKGQSATLYTGSAALAANNAGDPSDMHTITLEYYNGCCEGRLRVVITGGSANPDDTLVNAGGDPTDGSALCGWGRPGGTQGVNDSNTESYMWEEYLGGDQPANMRCYLEWRGAVRIRHNQVANPYLIYWDLWDFQGGTEGWLEVAEYIPVDPNATRPVPDRDAMTWVKVDVRQRNTRNYNWTRNTIDLSEYFNFSNPSGQTLLAFRFALATPGVTGTNKRTWFIDDIEVRSHSENVYTLDREWNLNNAAQKADFITTGGRSNEGVLSGWGLVSNMKNGPSGMSWHDSVGGADAVDGTALQGKTDFTDYRRTIVSPSNGANILDTRVHALEFNGWIDLENVPLEDSRGNSGDPALVFLQAYDLGAYAGLEVQYTTDAFDSLNPLWTTFPDGVLRNRSALTDARVQNFQEQVISLIDLPGDPERIRIRWALIVPSNATRRDGWWIDDIRLGREEDPKWTDYPFFDDAQDFNETLWRFDGAWSQSNDIGRVNIDEPNDPAYVRYSYSATAGGVYANNSTTGMVLKWPVDMYNNTPNKIIVGRTNEVNPQNSFGSRAVRPMLTFYHRRDLGATDYFHVEWKRVDEADTAWRRIWSYRHGMVARGSTNVRTATQFAWERVEVDLRPMLDVIGAPDAANPRKDDVLFRFSLVADNNNAGTGIWVDDIAIEEYEEFAFKFWPPDANRDSEFNLTGAGFGSGVSLLEDPDSPNPGRPWWESWYSGGDWSVINFHSRTGVMSFHDSPTGGQATHNPSTPEWDWSIPYNNGGCCGDINLLPEEMRAKTDTYAVKEMSTIIDMRAAYSHDKPQLRFWTRFIIGLQERVRVEVAYELPAISDSTMASSRCPFGSTNVGLTQCYEQLRGWSRWETVWERGHNTTRSATRSNGWTQERIDLSPYAGVLINPNNAAQNTPGKRIRIRFVYDGLDGSENFDGWYIDNVNLRYDIPTPSLVTIINERPFDDRSTSLRNWIPEGSWGLDPNFYIGTGGGPISLGLWNVRWWNCGGSGNNENLNNQSCESIGQKYGYDTSNRYLAGARIFLDNPSRPAPDRTQTVTNIQFNNGGGSPVPGWVSDRFLGEMTLDTPVVDALTGFAPGPRSFSTQSDDGVRLKVEELDASNNPVPAPWIINNWTNHSTTTDMGTFTFEQGRRYRITLQYFENTGGSVIFLTVTDGRFSFADSPKPGGINPDVMPLPLSNTSLVLNNIINLQGIPNDRYVLMEYQTRYRIDGDAQAYVEVSTDGGFTWTRNNLTSDVVINGVTVIPGSNFSSTSYSGYYGVNPVDYTRAWQVRQNNLTAYRGENLILRFRFDRRGGKTSGPLACQRRGDCNLNNRAAEEFNPGYYDGWWITAIRISRF
jgi:Flp pilus assembly pilin Flp